LNNLVLILTRGRVELKYRVMEYSILISIEHYFRYDQIGKETQTVYKILVKTKVYAHFDVNFLASGISTEIPADALENLNSPSVPNMVTLIFDLNSIEPS